MSENDGGSESLAEKIAAALFVNGDGERATRLCLKQKQPHDGDERDLGGRCFSAAVDEINAVLLAESDRRGDDDAE